MERLRATDGTYTFSFFLVENATISESTDLKSVLYNPTSIHELIHFVQDVSTLIGLGNLTRNSKLIANYHTARPDEKANLPFRPMDEVSVANRDLFSIYLRDDAFKSVPTDVRVEVLHDLNDLGSVKSPLPLHDYKVSIDYKGDVELFNFSGMSILEGMAAIFERWFFPQEQTLFDLPYDLCYLVARRLYPAIAVDPRFIFALCDASLLYYDAAGTYVKTLKMMAEETLEISGYQDIYSFALTHTTIENSSVMEELKRESAEAIKSFKNIMNCTFLDYPADWVGRTISFYFDLRSQNIGFLSDLLFMPRETGFGVFVSMIKKHGSPVILDSGGNPLRLVSAMENISEKDMYSMEYLIALRSVFESIFFAKAFECPFLSCKDRKCDTPIQTSSGSFCLYTLCRHLIEGDGNLLNPYG